MMPTCGYNGYDEKSTRKSCPPGEYYHYSNAGFSLLGLALDQFLSSLENPTTIEAFMTFNILRPLGMNDTSFSWKDLTKEQKERCAHGCYGGTGLDSCDAAKPLTDFIDRGFILPSGGMWSTTSDLAKFALSNFIPRLSFASIAERDSASEEDPSQMPHQCFSYGYGMFVSLPNVPHHLQASFGSVKTFELKLSDLTTRAQRTGTG